ncbi:hypothetical protein EYC84_003619 [Monilinia fructicola]|uniref:Uncharacterized protein n=1 Tax=Monilinia fructicola TaxID=38448 RepID=A0A5M9JV53_MONFR|nr:hypothetical protein EYC84_003619 [Monilinia fructicola]
MRLCHSFHINSRPTWATIWVKSLNEAQLLKEEWKDKLQSMIKFHVKNVYHCAFVKNFDTLCTITTRHMSHYCI